MVHGHHHGHHERQKLLRKETKEAKQHETKGQKESDMDPGTPRKTGFCETNGVVCGDERVFGNRKIHVFVQARKSGQGGCWGRNIGYS